MQNQTQVSNIIEGNLDASSSIIETRFKQCLGSSYETCKEIVQDIGEQLVDVQNDIDRIAPLQPIGSTNTQFKEFASSIKTGIALSFEKSNYMKKIRNLRELREELTALRFQVSALEAAAHTKPSHAAINRDVGARLCAIRKASMTLHEALSQLWSHSCHEASHSQHSTILCLDAKVDHCVCLDLAISYEKDRSTSTSR